MREDLMGRARPDMPLPCWITPLLSGRTACTTRRRASAIYMMGLVLEWLEKEVGGLAAMERRNEAKAALLYDYLDALPLSSTTRWNKPYRSIMNVTFTCPGPELDKALLRRGRRRTGFVNLKGHRSVGGMRASIYNAMPVEGVQALVDFMQKFEGAAQLSRRKREMYQYQNTEQHFAPKGLASCLRSNLP